ncbi:hypothetical protein CB1_000345003 [Camelus ferus]|nr:hypothetical protein CB1_000345003 [Camelus ferus]
MRFTPGKSEAVLTGVQERVSPGEFKAREAGSCFIRTDQLDGETDWKLKVAVSCTQRLPALGVSAVVVIPSFLTVTVLCKAAKLLSSDWTVRASGVRARQCLDLFSINAYVYAQKPQLDIHSFEGTFTREDSDPPIHESLSIENTLWAGTVVASGTVIGVVIYTGKETRSVMNTSNPKSKTSVMTLRRHCFGGKARFPAAAVGAVTVERTWTPEEMRPKHGPQLFGQQPSPEARA